MNARCAVFLGSSVLALLATSVQAASGLTRLSNSTFQDWSGSLVQMELNDGSLLNEYMAKTMSGGVDGAALVVSFFPRFNCAPVISVAVEAGTAIELNDNLTALDVLVDLEQVDFPVLLDSDDGAYRYSLNADQSANSDLLAVLDTGSRVFVSFSAYAQSGVGVVEPEASRNLSGSQVEFSLLGSKRASQAARDHCLAHIPLAYEN